VCFNAYYWVIWLSLMRLPVDQRVWWLAGHVLGLCIRVVWVCCAVVGGVVYWQFL